MHLYSSYRYPYLQKTETETVREREKEEKRDRQTDTERQRKIHSPKSDHCQNYSPFCHFRWLWEGRKNPEWRAEEENKRAEGTSVWVICSADNPLEVKRLLSRPGSGRQLLEMITSYCGWATGDLWRSPAAGSCWHWMSSGLVSMECEPCCSWLNLVYPV